MVGPWFAFAWLGALAACGGAQRGGAPLAPPVNHAPPADLGAMKPLVVPGETITWMVTFKGFEGGRARLAVGQPGELDGQPVIVLQAQAESSGLFAAIKQIHDDVTSWVSVDTGLPVRTESSSNFDGKHLVVHTQRRPGDLLVDQTVWKSSKPEPTQRKRRMPAANTHDPLSSLLALRAWDAAGGARGHFYTLGGATAWKTELTVIGRETIESPLGDQRAIRIEGVSTRLRPIKNKPPRTFTLWLSDDARRLPLVIAAHTEYGDIIVTATSYEKPAGK